MDETIDSATAGMGGAETKDYFWTTKLDKTTKTSKWDGSEVADQEQLVLKIACLGAGAKKGERNVVEVVSFDFAEEKQKSCICSLKLDLHESQSLGDLNLYPPAKFVLLEGSGPIHISGNHIILEDVDDDFSDDEDLEEMEENETMDDSTAKITEVDNEGLDDDSEEDADEEEENIRPAMKKRKSNGKIAVITKPKNSTKTNGNKSVSASESETNNSPKKAAKVAPKTIEEVKTAIKKVTGGKPRKQEKFRNWVKNTFKLKDDAWMEDLWKWHQKECGL